MAGKIDYKAYLAGLGQVETSNVERIKKYLDEQCEQDEALKTLYKPEKIDDCYKFIENAVREMPRKGNCACIDDAVVFKVARDYFLEILPTIAEEPPEIKTGAMPEDKAEGGTEAQEEEVLETCYDPDNDPDAEDDVVQVESCAMPEDVARDMSEDAAKEAEETVIPEEVKYDENGNGMLFEF